MKGVAAVAAAERAVDAYVAALPNSQREIAEAVRRLVRSAARSEGGVQVAQPGTPWRSPRMSGRDSFVIPQS